MKTKSHLEKAVAKVKHQQTNLATVVILSIHTTK
jgi:hypothetical protein